MPDPIFIKGEKITVKDDTGHVNFIGEEYITLTTNRWKDDNYMTGYRETNVLVNKPDWDSVVYHERGKDE